MNDVLKVLFSCFFIKLWCYWRYRMVFISLKFNEWSRLIWDWQQLADTNKLPKHPKINRSVIYMHCFEIWRSDVIESFWKLSGLKKYWYPQGSQRYSTRFFSLEKSWRYAPMNEWILIWFEILSSQWRKFIEERRYSIASLSSQ